MFVYIMRASPKKVQTVLKYRYTVYEVAKKLFCHRLIVSGITLCRLILITNKTIDKKSSHNPYMQDYARFFV